MRSSLLSNALEAALLHAGSHAQKLDDWIGIAATRLVPRLTLAVPGPANLQTIQEPGLGHQLILGGRSRSV